MLQWMSRVVQERSHRWGMTLLTSFLGLLRSKTTFCKVGKVVATDTISIYPFEKRLYAHSISPGEDSGGRKSRFNIRCQNETCLPLSHTVRCWEKLGWESPSEWRQNCAIDNTIKKRRVNKKIIDRIRERSCCEEWNLVLFRRICI